MSREAKELQDIWDPKEGDLIVWDFDGNFKQDLLRLKKASKQDLQDLDVFWLPRQEDLIKIMENNWEHGRCELIGHFHNFSWNYIHDRCEKYDFNELWLMVLMEYVYDKRWDGNGWVKQ
jgi:hypothetical protein